MQPPLPTNETFLKKVQVGIEATPGTLVAATRKLLADIQLAYEPAISQFNDRTGTRFAKGRFAKGRDKVSFTGTDQATFDDLAYWAQTMIAYVAAAKTPATGTVAAICTAIIGGSLTGSGSATTGYGWLFKPAATSLGKKSLSLEFGEPGNSYVSTQAMVSGWTLRGDPDSNSETAWMLDLEMLARDVAAQAYTGSIGDRQTNPIIAAGTKLYIDSTTMGTTQVLGKLISWSLVGSDDIHYKAFAEDANFVAANKIGFGESSLSGQIVFEFDDDTYFALLRAGTARKLLLYRDGVGITGSTGPVPHQMFIGIPQAQFTGISWGDREGNMTATISFDAYYDGTLGAPFFLYLVNGVAASGGATSMFG